ncbi:MAG: thioesterase [endosymbiont of Galathealinum brachiosum]|uniref:Thioesterase n=1 Tax=endosymbiont of Galathealinum brachiosum TaxID=2200906 RepID=A0A370DIB8_9GAMM|nr:MAG: thioesterase [endosymbiont of Galathealinum brachiosum]
MNLYLRLLILLIKSYWKPRLDLMDKSILKFYVLPNDLDINMHMNNGRYNSIMDLGRADIMLRTGLLRIIYRKKWFGLVGSIHTRFRRPLKPFQKYELHSQVIYWDDKWIWIEQKIFSKGKLISSALVQTIIRSKSKNIASPELMELMGFYYPSPEITEEIKHLQRFEPLE